MKGEVGWNHEYVLVPTAGEAAWGFQLLDFEFSTCPHPRPLSQAWERGVSCARTTGARLVAAFPHPRTLSLARERGVPFSTEELFPWLKPLSPALI